MTTYTITEAQRMQLLDWLKDTNNFYMRSATTLLQALEPEPMRILPDAERLEREETAMTLEQFLVALRAQFRTQG